MVALERTDLSALIDAYEEAVDAVADAADPILYDPGHDVEFREDLDGVYEQDRDVNNLATIAMAVRAGMPVIGWSPARRNPGAEDRVLRAERQFTIAVERLLSDWRAGRIDGEDLQSGISSVFVRQARNAFIAGKRSLGNLQPLSAADDADIASMVQRAGLGSDPRGFAGVLARVIDQSGPALPEGFRDQLEGYAGDLAGRTYRLGFERAALEREAEARRKGDAADLALATALVAYGGARDSQTPDLATYRSQRDAARAASREARAKATAVRDELKAARAAMADRISEFQTGATGRFRDQLGRLLRAVLDGRIDPGAAGTRLQDILRAESLRAFKRGRADAGGRGEPDQADLDAIGDDGADAEEDFLGRLPTPPPAITVGTLLYWMFLDPTNLIDPDVYRWLDRRIKGLSDRFYSISKMGERAAFRLGMATPAVHQIEQPPITLARDWLEKPPPVADPTPLGETVLVWWMLGTAAEHCPDCLTLTDGSPYTLDTFNQLGIFPGSGHTQCEAHCRCSLSYDVATTVCGDGMADEFWESSIGSVWVKEAASCSIPMDVDSLAGHRLLDADDPQVPDDAAFDWDADVAQSVTYGRPGVGVPQKVAWLSTPPPGQARYLKAPGTDGAGPVLTQRFDLDDTSYVAVFQEDADAIRFVTGYVDEGPAVFQHELTVAALRHFSQMATTAGKRLDFDPRLINPGMAEFLRSIGATPIPSPLIVPSAPRTPPRAERPLTYPAPTLPTAARAPRLGPVDDYALPVMPAWQRPPVVSYTWNKKAVMPTGFVWSADAREALDRLSGVLGIKPRGKRRKELLDAFTSSQLDSIRSRAEVLGAIGIDTSLSTGLRVMPDGGLAGEALRDGTIKLKHDPGLAGIRTAANSIGDVWAHEYGHLVAERIPRFEQRAAEWARRNPSITDYADADPGEAFAEMFSLLTRPDYVTGTIDGDTEIWQALRDAGIVRPRPRVTGLPPALPVFPDVENLVVDGKLLPGWTDTSAKVARKYKGASRRAILRDPQGREWFWKPEGVESEVGGAAVTTLFGLATPPVSRVKYGDEWGSIHPIIDATSLATVPYESLSRYEARDLLAHQSVDWLIGNPDGHTANYLRDAEGRIWAIDKASAFHSTPGTPLAHQWALWDHMMVAPDMAMPSSIAGPLFATSAGLRMLRPEDVAGMLARFDAVSDESFAVAARMGADSEQALAEMLRRKNALREQMEDVWGRVYARHRRLIPDDSPWHEWARTKRFDVPRLAAPDDLKPAKLDAEALLKPKESGFFKEYTPAQVRDAVLALPESQRMEAERLIRNVVTMWKKDVSVIPTDWQVWSFRGGTFTSPSVAVPPAQGMSAKPTLWPPTTVKAAAPGAPKTSWEQGLWKPTTPAGPMPEKVPKTPWEGDEWRIPKEGPIESAEQAITGSDVPLNTELVPWSGSVPFEEPPLPPGAMLSWQTDELRKKAHAAWFSPEDVKAKRVDYALSNTPADDKVAKELGLKVRRLADNRYYIARSEKYLDELAETVALGNTDSDWFWMEWLGYSKERLAAIDAYEATKKAKGLRAGVMIVEPDGRVWFQAPRNQFAGYENTWSKGGIDEGETAAMAAVREAREELGLSVELDGYLGDFTSTDGGSITRYYIAHRVGGGPRFAARKETYAIRLGTPAQVRPVLLRNGKLDKRDTEVLDAFLEQQGLPPVAPLEPDRGVIGQSIDDVATPRGMADVPAEMGIDQDVALAMGDMYSPKMQGDVAVWDISTLWGNAKTAVVGNHWAALLIDKPGAQGVPTVVAGAALAIMKASGDNGLTISLGKGWMDDLQPLWNALGVQSGSVPIVAHGLADAAENATGIVLTKDQVAQAIKLLEQGKVAAPTPTLAVPSTATPQLATALSPADPLNPPAPAMATTGSFSAHPAMPAAKPMSGTYGYEQPMLDDIRLNRFLGEGNTFPGTGPATYSYTAPNGTATVKVETYRANGRITLISKQDDLNGLSPHERTAYTIDAIVRMADEVLDTASTTSSFTIAGPLVTHAGLDELVVAFGGQLTGTNFWRFDARRAATLRQAILTDAVPDIIGVVPAQPLAHGAQAVATSPAVAHTVASPPPATPAPPVTTAVTPPLATQFSWDADMAKSLTQGGHYVNQFKTVPNTYMHNFGDPAVMIEWKVTPKGNLQMVGLNNLSGTVTDEQMGAAVVTWLLDMGHHMTAYDLGKPTHLAVTFTDETWNALPTGINAMFTDAGAHGSLYGGMVLGRKDALALSDNIAAQMAAYVPAGAAPSQAIPTPPPPPPVTPPPPPPTAGLASKVGHEITGDGGFSTGADKITVNAIVNGDTVVTEVATWPTGMLLMQSKFTGAQGEAFFVDGKVALSATTHMLKMLPTVLNTMPTPTSGSWMLMIPPGIAAQQVTLRDFLVQAGAKAASDGSLVLDSATIAKVSNHIISDTLPIPSAAAANVVPPPAIAPSGLALPEQAPFWAWASSALPNPTTVPNGYSWTTGPTPFKATVSDIQSAPIITSIVAPGGDVPEWDAAFVGTFLAAAVPDVPFHVTDDTMMLLSPGLMDGLIAAGATAQPASVMFGPYWTIPGDQVKFVWASLHDALQSVTPPTITAPIGIPTAQTVLGSGGIDQATAAKLVDQTTADFHTAKTVADEKWWWGPNGETSVSIVETSLTTRLEGVLTGDPVYATVASIMNAPPGKGMIITAQVPLPQAFKDTLSAIHPGVTQLSGGVVMDAGGMNAVRSQLQLELLTAKPVSLGVTPPPSTSQFAGQTVAVPLAPTGGATMPAPKLDLGPDYDAANVSYMSGTTATVKPHPMLSGTNTAMKVTTFGAFGKETQASWRRLGNTFEVWDAQDAGGFVALMRYIDGQFTDNPKLTALYVKPPVMAHVSAELGNILHADYGLAASGGKLTPSQVRAFVKAADDDVQAVLNPPVTPVAAPTSSPLGNVPGYTAQDAAALMPFTETTFDASFLQGANTKLKQAHYGMGHPNGTSVSWRRLGNQLQVFHINANAMSAGATNNHIIGHVRRMADEMDKAPKITSLTFVYAEELPQEVRDALGSFGVKEAGGKVTMTREQVMAVRSAIENDAGLPATIATATPTAAPVVPAAPTIPASALGKVPGYDATAADALVGTTVNVQKHPKLTGANTTMKQTHWAAPSGQVAVAEWRRLGNALEYWGGAVPDGTNTVLAQMRQFAEMIDGQPKITGLIIKQGVLDADMEQVLRYDFGAKLTAEGHLKMTPAQVQNVRDALLSDAGQPVSFATPPAQMAPTPPAAVVTPPTAPTVVIPPPPPLVADPLFKKMLSAPPTVVGKSSYIQKLKFNKGKHGNKIDVPAKVSTWNASVVGFGNASQWANLPDGAKWAGMYHLAKMVADGTATVSGVDVTVQKLVFSGTELQQSGMLGLLGMAAEVGVKAAPTGAYDNTPYFVFDADAAKLLVGVIAQNKKARVPFVEFMPDSQMAQVKSLVQAGVQVNHLAPVGSFGQAGWSLKVGPSTFKLQPDWSKVTLTTPDTDTVPHVFAAIQAAQTEITSQAKTLSVMSNDPEVHKILGSLGGQHNYNGTVTQLAPAYFPGLFKSLDNNKVPDLPLKPPPGITQPAYVPPVAAAPVTTASPPPAVAPAAAPPPAYTPPPGPQKPPPPAATVWVPPSTSAAAAHKASTQVTIPPSKALSKKFGYDRTEVKQFTALGSSDVDLGELTTNLIPQQAHAARWVTSGSAPAIEARYAERPAFTTLAFTGMSPNPGVSGEQYEAGFWASLQKFARDQADRVDDSGAPVAKADLFVTDEIYENRPALKQMLIDIGGNEYVGTTPAGGDLVVTNVTLGKIVKQGSDPDADPFIKGRDFWRAYGDGIRLDKTMAKRLADALDADTLDTALQGQVLAAAPPPPVLKVKPTGTADNEPIKYMGVHPDHLYLAGNEVIGEDGLRAVSRWAGGEMEATWLRTPNVLEWRGIKVSGTPSEATVRASVVRHLYTMLEDLGQHPGMVLDVYDDAYAAVPDLRDLLLRYKGRQVAVGRDDFIRLNAAEAGILRIDLQLELGALKAPGAIKPVVDPIVWPSPGDLKVQPLIINGKPVKGQTKKAIFKDSDGNEWLFKPGATGRGTHADVAVHQLSQLLGLRTPPVKTYVLTLDGKATTGTLQRLVPDLKHVKQVDTLTADQQDELLHHSVLDWLVANDDAHIENVMLDGDGHVWAIDKTRSWKGMGQRNDSLDPDLNGQGGVSLPPAINLWWRAVRKDPAVLSNVSPKTMGRILRYVDAIDDDTFLRVLKPVLDDVGEIPAFRTREAFEKAVLKRKHDLKADLEGHFRKEVGRAINTSPSSVPSEWRDWVAAGGEFKLLATPHEQVLEMMADLDRQFGAQYSAAAAENALKNPPAGIKGQVQTTLTEMNRYSGGGTGGTSGFGAETIRVGREEGFDYVTKVNTWAMLHQLFDSGVSVNGAIAELRAAYNPDLGLFIMRRGVSRAGDPATYLKGKASTGFRSVMGGSWGAGPTRYAGGSPQMTLALRPEQVFMSSVTFQSRFRVGGEAELMFRDLTIDQVIRMDRGSHDWRSEFGLMYDYSDISSTKRKEVYRRIWALKGGPVTGPHH